NAPTGPGQVTRGAICVTLGRRQRHVGICDARRAWMDDRRPPRRGDGGSSLPSNRYTPGSGYRPRTESSSRESSSRGPRDWRDQEWREEDWRTPPTRPRSSSERRPPSRGASRDGWNDAPQRRSARAGAGYAGESGPRSRSARYGNEDTWTPASMRNGYGA